MCLYSLSVNHSLIFLAQPTSVSPKTSLQKHIKTLQNKLTKEILKDDPDLETVESLKNEIKEIKAKNLGNNPTWLANFASEDQKKVLESQPT